MTLSEMIRYCKRHEVSIEFNGDGVHITHEAGGEIPRISSPTMRLAIAKLRTFLREEKECWRRDDGRD